MAVILINAHKDMFSNTTSRGIGYILREDKSAKQSFWGCSKENAIEDYKNLFNNRLNPRKDNITYYHIKQTFAPNDNVDISTAHEIGNVLSSDFVEKGHQVVLSTHIDSGKIHNHLIISSVSINTLRVIKQDKKWFYGYRNLNDDILNKYNFLTCADLRQQKSERRKNEIGENKYLGRGIITDKIKIIDILNKYIYNDDINNIYSMIKTINLSEDYKCNLRGRTLTFTTPEGKKIRPATISKEFSTDSIEKKLKGIYTDENKLYDIVTDSCKNIKNEKELMNNFEKNNIVYANVNGELIFNNDIPLRDIIGKPYSILKNEFKLNEDMISIKDELKNILKNQNLYSLDDFFDKALNIELVTKISIHKNTILIDTELGSFDLYKISDNTFNYSSIKQNIFINATKNKLDNSLKNNIHKDIFDFLQEEKIEYEKNPKNNKFYFLFEGKKINLNRLFKINESDPLYKELFKFLSSITNPDDFFKNTDFTFNEDKNCYFYKNTISLEHIDFQKLSINKENISIICEYNKLNDIVNKSLTFKDFLKKYSDLNLSVKYDYNTIESQINSNFTVKSFFNSLKNVYSLDDYYSKMEHSKLFNFHTYGESIIFKSKKNDTFYKSDLKFVNKIFKDNLIKKDIFTALKESYNINDFKKSLLASGHSVSISNNSIYIDDINIKDLNVINKYSDNLFDYSEILERLNQNHDYKYKTELSFKSQFSKIYFEAIKNSNSIDSFKIRLLENNTFDFKFDENFILFKPKNKNIENYINSDKYNNPNFKIFDLNRAEEIINENHNKFNKFALLSIIKLFNNTNKNKQNNIDKEVSKIKYMRLKAEFESNKRNLKR